MFIYSFPKLAARVSQSNSDAPLLTRLEVRGPYVTFYYRIDVGDALFFLINKGNFRIVQGDNLDHADVHGKDPLVLLLSQRDFHMHLKLNNKDIKVALRELLGFIFANQKPEMRQQHFKDYRNRLDQQRIRANQREFPENVKQAVSNFNTSTPFITAQNEQQLIDDVIAQYERYLKTPTLLRCEELMTMYLIGLTPGYFSPVRTPATAALVRVVQPIYSLSIILKHLKRNPQDITSYQNINEIIDSLNPNRSLMIESSASKLRSFATHLLNHVVNLLPEFIRFFLPNFINNLLPDPSIAEIAQFENPNDNYFCSDLPLKERLAFVQNFANEQLLQLQPSQNTSNDFRDEEGRTLTYNHARQRNANQRQEQNIQMTTPLNPNLQQRNKVIKPKR